MTTYLVTGGAGFIGSHIVDKLIDNGDKVIVVDNLSTGKKENLNDGAIFYKIDIRNEKLSDIFEKENPDYVIHHAAQIDVQRSISDPVFDGDVNILGTINLLECCKEYDVKKVIYASSAAVYGEPEYLPIDEKHSVEPISYYGISKHTPEHYIKVYSQLHGIKYTILRYANVFGIRQDPKGEGGVMSIFMDKFFNGEIPTIYGDGEQTRDFVYVDDIARANILAVNNGDNEIINIGTGVESSVNRLFDVMNKVYGKEIEPNYGQARKGDIEKSYFDNSKAKEILGWEPEYGLEEGVRETVEYYKGQF